MNKEEYQKKTEWVNHVNSMAEQVRILALNLAISLAQERDNIRELTVLEADFTELIHGAVEVIKDVTAMLQAYQNEGKMVYSPPASSSNLDHIETSLNEILAMSKNILGIIADIKEGQREVDKYNEPLSG